MIVEILEILFLILSGLIISYLVRHYIFTLMVLREAKKGKRRTTKGNIAYQPVVSTLIPARNEERVIGRILQRMTELTYPKDKMQIIVIDDASTDATGRIAEEYSKLNSYIEVIHRSKREGGVGKAAALNVGSKHAEGEIIVCFDADYYPEREILEELTMQFADPKVGAVQGRIIVLNEPKNIVTRLIALERIGGYRIDQQARDSLGLITQFGGTAGAVRRSLLEGLGGWDESILAEDTDLTFRLYLIGYKIPYLYDAECYEEAVESWHAYWKQRYRWAKGHMQCAFKHLIGVLKSKNLSLKEKIDGFLLLNIYFMPVFVLLSWVTGIPLFFLHPPQWFSFFWAFIPISLYSFVGNFAPFFEVGIGTYLDDRNRAQWLIPLLIFTFLLNIFICTKALIDLTVSKIIGRNANQWTKTPHSGNGNTYIKN